jgi:superoxide dismutase, Cu-Zn family
MPYSTKYTCIPVLVSLPRCLLFHPSSGFAYKILPMQLPDRNIGYEYVMIDRVLFHCSRKGNTMKRILTFLGIASVLLNAQHLTAQDTHAMHQMAGITKAIAVITPTKGNSVNGSVRFEQVVNGVRVTVQLAGLTPGNHGFHIHEFGDISSSDGSSAGGHFNPAGMPHSAPASEKRHEGDMGNITADKDGNAHLEYIDRVLELTGDNSIIGRAIIIHEKEDDYTTQPTGNAGARIGYGVIGIAK